MADNFASHSPGLTSPANRLSEVTPNDGADLAFVTRAINVAASGTVEVTTEAGDTGAVYIAAGVAFPIRATRIWATGTSATGIVALA